MKNIFEKLKNNEIAVGLICGGAAILVIAAVIAIVIINLLSQDTVQTAAESSGTVSKISLDTEFTYSEQASSISSSKKSSNKTASSNYAVSSSEKTTSASASSKPGRKKYTSSQSPAEPAKPKQVTGTSKAQRNTKVDINNRSGLAKRNSARAIYLADSFYNNFYNEENDIMLLNYPVKNQAKTATAWEYGAMQSMQSVIADLSRTDLQKQRLIEVNNSLEYYRSNFIGAVTGKWGYAVSKSSSPGSSNEMGLAYDDNMWIAINFIRSYKITGNKSYLNKAKYLMKFIISDAWFEPLGGIFWDTRHEARHSCSNNPMIKPLCDIYELTGDEYYLNWAKKIYEFSVSKLKDNERNIYEDLIGAHRTESGEWIEGSSKNTGFYSYNTGTMISGAAALYGATGDKKYLDEALSCAQGAMNYFGDKTILPGYTNFACTSNIWFNCILLRGYIDLYEYAPSQTAGYINEFQKSIDYAYEHYDGESGFIPYNWLEGWDASDRSTYRNALDMSANAEMYGMLAIWQKTRKD